MVGTAGLEPATGGLAITVYRRPRSYRGKFMVTMCPLLYQLSYVPMYEVVRRVVRGGDDGIRTRDLSVNSGNHPPTAH